MVGGAGGATDLSRFAAALALRIAREAGVEAHAQDAGAPAPVPGCEVLVRVGLPDPPGPGAEVDLVLLLEADSPGAAVAWRDTLLASGLSWASIGGAADGRSAPARPGAFPASPTDGSTAALDTAPDTAFDTAFGAALGAAVDAATPLLRRRALVGTGLFTRLARRNAEHAGWRWTCESCDVPECEHALRVASRMDTGPTLR